MKSSVSSSSYNSLYLCLDLVKAEKTLMSHDVFISFRGEDTRRGFVSHLQDSFKRNKIRTYKDDCHLERGNEISYTLLRAIEVSKISIIVFSENYASSKWTLDELVRIMNCRRTRGQIVLPIFYRTSPSEVRKKRNFSTGGSVLRSSSKKETEQRWAKAMEEAAGLAGWESSNYRTESLLVEVIANEVKKQLKSMSHASSKGLSPQPNSGGLSHDDDPTTPQDSSPRKLLLHGSLNLLGYLGEQTRDIFLRNKHEILILTSRSPGPSSSLDPSGYFYRNPFVPKREQSWWGIKHKHV